MIVFKVPNFCYWWSLWLLTPGTKKCSYDIELFYVFLFFSKKKKSAGQFKSLCHAARKGARKGSQARKKDTKKRKWKFL